jgi:hypothetical protein
MKVEAMLREKNTILVALCAAISIHGCAVTGTYPSHWPELGQAQLVGKCPDISGKYKNHGLSSPSEAKQLTLAKILGLEDGDVVEITQSPDMISVSLHTPDGRLVERDFFSCETSIGWDMGRPQSFLCPFDILSGRILLLSDLERDHTQSLGGAYGLVYANWAGAPLQKATDGSLVVKFEKGSGALIGLLPLGTLERVWYRFESLD